MCRSVDIQPLRLSRLRPRERGRILRFCGTARSVRRELTDEALDMEWRAIDDEKQDAEAPIALEALRLFRDQRDDVISRIEKLAERGLRAPYARDMDDEASLMAVQVFDIDRWIRETIDRLSPHLLKAVESGFDAGALRVDAEISFFADDDRVRRVVREVNSKIRDVPATTLEKINRQIVEGLRANESWSDITRRIKQEFDEFSPYRARLIGQTSGTPTFEQGQTISWSEAGLSKRRGLSQRDGRVRQSEFDHTEFDLQEVAMDEPFVISGEELMFPGDTSLGASKGNTIGCRCSQLPVEDDDE